MILKNSDRATEGNHDADRRSNALAAAQDGRSEPGENDGNHQLADGEAQQGIGRLTRTGLEVRVVAEREDASGRDCLDPEDDPDGGHDAGTLDESVV